MEDDLNEWQPRWKTTSTTTTYLLQLFERSTLLLLNLFFLRLQTVATTLTVLLAAWAAILFILSGTVNGDSGPVVCDFWPLIFQKLDRIFASSNPLSSTIHLGILLGKELWLLELLGTSSCLWKTIIRFVLGKHQHCSHTCLLVSSQDQSIIEHPLSFTLSSLGKVTGLMKLYIL